MHSAQILFPCRLSRLTSAWNQADKQEPEQKQVSDSAGISYCWGISKTRRSLMQKAGRTARAQRFGIFQMIFPQVLWDQRRLKQILTILFISDSLDKVKHIIVFYIILSFLLNITERGKKQIYVNFLKLT